jgi:CheY-like chemotaxis protein
MRILVVEDEATIREGLKARLADAGFTVDVAADGEEGLFAGQEYPIDVAIIDLGLPKLSVSISSASFAHRRRLSPFSCSRRATAGRTRCRDWKRARTTTYRSRSTSRKCLLACRR